MVFRNSTELVNFFLTTNSTKVHTNVFPVIHNGEREHFMKGLHHISLLLHSVCLAVKLCVQYSVTKEKNSTTTIGKSC